MLQHIAVAIVEYRTAVRETVHFENHGSHGDGKLEAARKAEAAARRNLCDVIAAALPPYNKED